MQQKEKVFARIDEKRDEIVELVRSLIRTKPINPAYNDDTNERKAQQIITDRLKKIENMKIDHFDVELDKLEKYRDLPGFITGYTDKLPWEDRPNILARLSGKNPEKGRSLILTGHTDVVAADDVSEWAHPPFDAVVENGILYGRGSVDMLSGVGAMLAALEAIFESGIKLDGDLWFSSSVGEEAGGTGFLATADYINKNGIKIDAGIMTEPTNLDLSLLCRGIIWGEVIIKGRTGHLEVTQPHWSRGGAVDAIEKARYIMDAIDELNKEWSARPDKNHPLLTESNQIKVAMIEGGHHFSSYSDHCKLSFNIQVLPQESDENGLGTGSRKEFEDFIQRVAESDDWLRENPPKVNWVLEADCAEVKEDHPFVDVFKKSAKDLNPLMNTVGSGFHTDTGSLDRISNIPTVNFGPGDQKLAHITNEHCKVEDIITATKVIAATCLEWCNEE
ncbi:ArgE/DapE family deacylase [Oceanobacillus alkalisoli]|uniref:ArgE/DapE family deacylase n=1 Tax=Oceanobacillus alkalisoli TaxID=2925113 RepID=UPI001EEFBF4C|nr:ArgE/DapE family deacylase [Oceanobacillus alkalisoli]MCF3944122.1 ArgE/DapE family deacylase [Oceanobacillus alkalisoli]MCG5102531.1 ArgE/DapE family deacylase [Oceanobacillus alkalisoli]